MDVDVITLFPAMFAGPSATASGSRRHERVMGGACQRLRNLTAVPYARTSVMPAENSVAS